jgi:Flp pilus assembly protein TadG
VSSRSEDQRGAVLLEAALILPILMMFILGIIDLGMWDYQKSQVASGARDGARAAIPSVTGADCAYPCSDANTRIHDAIAARLGSAHGFTFTVRCRAATTSTTKPCVAGPGTVDRDRVEVSVRWTRPAMTFVSKMVGASSTVSATSTMTISG